MRQLLRKSLFLIAATISLTFFGLTLCPLSAAEPSAQRVLFISSYHPQFPTFFQQIEGIRSVLDPLDILLDIEFMDTKRFVHEQNLVNFHRSLAYKLAHTKPYDAIITGDDAALRFALEHQHELFSQQPIVFTGVNNLDLARSQNDNQFVTGVVEAVSMQDTLELMVRLHPELNRIIALVDGMPSGQADLQTYYRLGAEIGSVKLTHLSLEDLSFAELATRLKSLDKDSAVLLLSAYRDKTGRTLSFHKSLKLITEHLARPLYHLWHHGIGDGILGGKVISHRAQGESAANLVAQILAGRSVADIEVEETSPNRFFFDYRQLTRYGISVDSLPKDSGLLHQPPRFYQLNRTYIWLLAASVIGLCSVVSVLLLHIRSRKRYEKALEGSEARYRAIVDDQTELICRNRPEGTLTFVNEAYCRYFGRDRQDLVGSNLLPMVAEQDRAVVEQHFSSLGPDNPVATYQHQVLAAEGHVRWMQWTNRAIMDRKGQVVEIQGVGRDVTEQKLAEATLRDREQFLSSILAATPIGMGVTRNRTLTWASDNLLNMLGYKSSEVVGKSARLLYESDWEYERVGYIKYRAMEIRGTGSLETRWVKKNGQVVDILLSSSFVDPRDPAAGATFTAMDITDRKLAEAGLQKALADAREARDQIEAILRSVADGLVFTDRDNRIVLMSDSAEKMLGKKTAEVFLQPIGAIMDNRMLSGQLNRISKGGRGEAMIEIELPGGDVGERRTIQAKSAAVKGSGLAAAGVITLLRDVTRERSLDQLKSEFIATAAHELRTPLTAVMGFSELLLSQRHFSPEEQREFLATVHRKSEVLSNIVDDMLDLARLDAGRMIRVEKTRADIDKLIQERVADCRDILPNHRFEYFGPGRPVVLQIDERRICHVLENLLNNAASFSPEGSLVTVRCEAIPAGLRITVQDEGIGMTAEQAGLVFDKFYRVDASNTAQKGIGLGLAIVKGIVEAHDGQISIESAVGKGTKVTVTLPREELRA